MKQLFLVIFTLLAYCANAQYQPMLFKSGQYEVVSSTTYVGDIVINSCYEVTLQRMCGNRPTYSLYDVRIAFNNVSDCQNLFDIVIHKLQDTEVNGKFYSVFCYVKSADVSQVENCIPVVNNFTVAVILTNLATSTTEYCFEVELEYKK